VRTAALGTDACDGRAHAVPGRVGIVSRWQEAAQLVAEHRDVLDARPSPRPGDDAFAVPAPLVSRGWAAFLAELDETALVALEIDGHEATWPSGAPSSLVALLDRARAVCAIAPLDDPCMRTHPVPASRRFETPRKSAQIDAFARVILPLARGARRVVDVGSGHGHLTREIAERIALPVVGLERDDVLAGRARTLASSDSPSFAVTDVLRDGLSLSPDDCVIGLHACGELGDAMVVSAARSGASIALVGCCLQKRRGVSRAPLCAAGPEHAGALDLPKGILGLSNLTARDDGVEATRAENLAGRERRLALHRLLSAHDPGLRLGAEIDGLNRRAAQRDLASLVARAFAMRRLEPPSAAAVADAATWARVQHARLRRLSLARAMLARVLEVFVLLDRARHLEEQGFGVTLGTLFPASTSARNLVLLAQR
jgi:SAM-dependent methyltransferase